MEDFYLRQWLYTSQTFDWTTILALAVVSFIYFLGPTLGYEAKLRGCLVAALFAILAKLALLLLDNGLMTIQMLADGPRSRGGSSEGMVAIHGVLSFLEMGLLVLGIGLFVIGLLMLRRSGDRREAIRRAELLDED